MAADSMSLRQESDDWRKGTFHAVKSLRNKSNQAVMRLRAYSMIENLDLLLNFEDSGEFRDYPYRLIGSTFSLSDAQSRVGGNSSAFRVTDAVTLLPEDGSIFSLSEQNFTIGFWLNPLRLGDGEILFSYQSSVVYKGEYLQQNVTAFFAMEHLVWRFENIFFEEDGTPLLIELKGEPIFKNTWSHHAVSFDTKRGYIQLLNNNIPVDSYYTNRHNNANFPTFPAIFQPTQDKSLILGQFFGYLDGLFISRNFMDRVSLDSFNQRGYFISEPLFVEGKIFEDIVAEHAGEDHSSIRVWLRGDKSALLLKSLPDDFGWHELDATTYLAYLNEGNYRYLQLRVEFFAGKSRRSTPILSDITLHYYMVPLPPRPGMLRMQREGNDVRILWQPVIAGNVAGYRLYFGTESGEYLGVSAQGASPLDAQQENSLLLYGLERGRMYYIVLVTYDELGRESQFSPELMLLL